MSPEEVAGNKLDNEEKSNEKVMKETNEDKRLSLNLF